ncbi:helix-turn-helix transcriptional regulator [bacterium]|nr:helix-turn-helix transcriptional regulator [bacterium]
MQKRRALGLSQEAVAVRVGISRQHYCRIERGLSLPNREQAAMLSEVLATAVVHADQLYLERERRDRSGYGLYALGQVSSEPWRVHQQARGVESAIDRATWEWLQTFVHADSSYECSGLCDLVKGGAEPMVDSPLLWGFDRHVLLDSKGQLLGARYLPCLGYRKGALHFVLWPQVTLRTELATVRVDGLLYFSLNGSRGWLVLEFDGPGHQLGQDGYRARIHGIPELRFRTQEIRARRCLEMLLGHLDQAAPKRS